MTAMDLSFRAGASPAMLKRDDARRHPDEGARMPDEYAPGTPSWVDLASQDLDASAAFYGGLFGWESMDAGPPEETGATEDCDATVGRTQQQGGSVNVPQMEIEQGRLSVLADPQGAPFAVMQTKNA
jgi:predicted enzyme related to lactoylglutathione lyase